MWYTPLVSVFAFRIHDCDATLLRLWNTHVDAIQSDPRSREDNPYKSLITLSFSGQPDWENLMEWAHAVWARELGSVAHNPDYSGLSPGDMQMISLIMCVLQLARNRNIRTGKTWKHLERDLEVVREFANANDPRW